MNTDQTTAEQQRVIQEEAASYALPEPQSHTLLMPHRESIAMLRHKGASYRAIAKILGKVNISVSLDTLSRFCRETIELKPVGKKRRRPVFPSPSDRTEMPSLDSDQPQKASDRPVPTLNPEGAEPAAPPRGKGPRIADPNSI